MVDVRINETLCTGEVFLLGCFPQETSPAAWGVLCFIEMSDYF